MTGLLQRLGARATGTAWAVRSDVRLPFGAERMAELQAPTAADAAPGAAPQRPRVQAHARTEDARTDPAPLAADPAPCTPVADTQQPNQQHAAPSAAVQASHAQQQPPAALLPATKAQPLATQQAAGEPAPAGTRAAPASTAAPRVRTAASMPPDAPEPLLPATVGSLAQPSNATRAAFPTAIGQQRSPATAQQDTEVHIHIGRIDVTALHEAPKPKARPRERAQPMSLDAYLAKRGNAP